MDVLTVNISEYMQRGNYILVMINYSQLVIVTYYYPNSNCLWRGNDVVGWLIVDDGCEISLLYCAGCSSTHIISL